MMVPEEGRGRIPAKDLGCKAWERLCRGKIFQALTRGPRRGASKDVAQEKIMNFIRKC